MTDEIGMMVQGFIEAVERLPGLAARLGMKTQQIEREANRQAGEIMELTDRLFDLRSSLVSACSLLAVHVGAPSLEEAAALTAEQRGLVAVWWTVLCGEQKPPEGIDR